MHFAKHSAANALTDGCKTVELCQAYILMSLYAVPAKRWEEDRSWLYTRLAIRIATDLNLHQAEAAKPQNEKQELEIISGSNKRVEIRSVTLKHDAYLTEFHEEWEKRFNDAQQPGDCGSAFRCLLLPFLVGYSRLVMFSFGFQQAYQRGLKPGDDIFFNKCLEAAKTVVRIMIENLAPSGYMRSSSDGHFIFASFASAFLTKLLRPEFAHLLLKEEENDIFDLISRLIQTFSAIAVDDRHTPKLHARFLAGLLSKHRRDGATVGRLQALPSPPQQMHNMIDQFGDSNLVGSDGNAVGEEEIPLATMQALKNPAWWQNMMMPGFSWSDPSSPSSNSNAPGPPTPSSYGTSHYAPIAIATANDSSYGIFHAAQQVPLY
ncbi:hypothetical protein BDP27DRAFT_1416550 [Rhodocollybia butyracea]|uniref:Uncharacterized protein n=1 Tax=Rhodocollybia butyracea TaxID=206335 RepID=A0A9P5UCL1_9AGAR|nr:hypothetical protein BDP27DRAFT_1416550 [Rhodocollybia butyracea]